MQTEKHRDDVLWHYMQKGTTISPSFFIVAQGGGESLGTD